MGFHTANHFKVVCDQAEFQTGRCLSPELPGEIGDPRQEGGKVAGNLFHVKQGRDKMPRVIALANQKGGVGKSTTAVNLGAALAMSGKPVLIIDVDPQGNTTSGLGIDRRALEHCVYDSLMNDWPPSRLICKTQIPGLDLIPATLRLAGAEIELVSVLSRETRLRQIIASLGDGYKYIMIDCPPSLGLLTLNALAAADGVMIPIQCEYYALEGLTSLMDVISLVRKRLNPDVELEGVLLTMYDSRLRLAEQVSEEVREFFKQRVYETVIPRNVKVSEAPSFGKPVVLYAPESRGAKAYMKLAKEVIKVGKKGTRPGIGRPAAGK